MLHPAAKLAFFDAICPEFKQNAIDALKEIYQQYSQNEETPPVKHFKTSASKGLIAGMLNKINTATIKKNEIEEYLASMPEDTKILDYWKVKFIIENANFLRTAREAFLFLLRLQKTSWQFRPLLLHLRDSSMAGLTLLGCVATVSLLNLSQC